MTVTIELHPEIEAGLALMAAEQGVPLPHLLRRLLEELSPQPAGAMKSNSERAAFWRQSAQGLPVTAPLSDHAVSRESIYDARG